MSLPLLYERWMREALSAPVPEEGLATCSQCVMCPGNKVGRPHSVATFNPATKCCTYLPTLRNFHVGQILADPEPAMQAGQRSVRARIEAQIGVTPLGLLWPASFETEYDQARDRDFGRRVDLLCPHFVDRDGGLCGVWRHRNAICSTWFCRYERGEKGQTYWEALRELLDTAEEILAWRCIEDLDVGAQARALLEDGDNPCATLDGSEPVTEAMRRVTWGRWFGRELEFYQRAGELISALSWRDVAAYGGARLQRKVEAVEEAIEDLHGRRLPPFVEGGAITVITEADDGAWVRSYRAYDAMFLGREVLEVVQGLRAIDLDDLRERLEDRLGAPVADQVLRHYLDVGLLKPSLPFGPGDGP
jgi:hypothetical protein